MYYALAFALGAAAAWYPTYRYYDNEKKAIGRAMDDFHMLITGVEKTGENVRAAFANFSKSLKATFHL